jgi:hypothetical protein
VAVGYSGTGTFVQSGGTINSSEIELGRNPGSSGSYSLSGNGQLSTGFEIVGNSGTGTFTQSGGIANVSDLWLSNDNNAYGTYNLSGSGQLSAQFEAAGGQGGPGTITQSGGTNSVVSLQIGCGLGSGTYSLTGSGQLSAVSEYVGVPAVPTWPNANTTGTFMQIGGMNAVSLLVIGSRGSYSLAGGTLQVNGNLLNQGIFAGGSGPAALIANGIVDLSAGTLQNVGTVSVRGGANSLLIVPAGFDPWTGFASYSTLGLIHTLGTTLQVPAGQGFGGSGSISDPVNCQGMIMAVSGGTINLSGGLTLSGTGTVNLGSGTLTTNDLISGVSGGSLSVYAQYVGSGGTGSFTQSGGANVIGTCLYLGLTASDSGTYNLSGSGLLSATAEVVGILGTGTFT